MQHLTIATTADFVADDPRGAVVILNLIRFHADGGRESYQQYLEAAKALPDSEVEWIYCGTLHHSLESTIQPDWDAVVLARYPSRAAFFDATQSPAYQRIRHLRDTAIADSLLQPSTSLMH